MKLIITILSFLTAISLYGQIDIEIFFYDDCSRSVKQAEYILFNVETNELYESSYFKVKIPSVGVYLLSTGIENENKDFIGSFSKILNIKSTNELKDTLKIPKVKFTTENVLHSSYWDYFNCEKLCEGEETDFYENGNIRLKGQFKNGKPIEITEYRENGIKETTYWFKEGFMDYKKIEHFDNEGKLEEYEIHINRKTKTVKKVYNSLGKFLRKEITNHYIEK